MNLSILSTALSATAFVVLLALTTIPSRAATPINLKASLSQPLSNAEKFLIRHPNTNVSEKGVQSQAPGYTIRQLRNLQVLLRERSENRIDPTTISD
ncbi:MAG: hypothetical protein H7Y37_10875 [Anaerolineae bacterium]|nr:hypothetical protein [Gloeobacterales cyanobacterium ES-bin-313]